MSPSGPLDDFKRAIAGAVRALADDGNANVQFGNSWDRERSLVSLPLPSPERIEVDAGVIRGLADAAALRLRFHDEDVHQRCNPRDSLGRELLDAAERARYEALGENRFIGVAQNLEKALVEESGRKLPHHSEEDPPLADALRLLVRERLTGRASPPSAEAIAAPWRKLLESRGEAHLDALGEVIDNQEAFARLFREFLDEADIRSLAQDTDAEETQEEGSDDESPPDNVSEEAEDESTDAGSSFGGEGEEEDGEKAEVETATGDPGEDGSDEGDSPPGQWTHPPDTGEHLVYRVYTDSFDETVGAEALCDPDELTRLRAALDGHLSQFEGMIARLAHRLQRKLLAQQVRWWEFDLEEGILDCARLTRTVINPSAALSFKREAATSFRDTVVTLLLDNSGSMRGRPITVAAVSADILARTLERCGVKVEILGFTTRSWKGGRAREEWVKAGKPPDPGRLNELRHIVYKAADVPWRRSRRNLGLMLREGLLKENIDGEALDWAHRRLLARPEQRRILMVVSDGAPVDDSTLSVNSGNYLDLHLRKVIEWIEKSSPVELVSIGIGHDVTRYYARAVTIFEATQLGGAITEQLVELFSEKTVPAVRGPLAA